MRAVLACVLAIWSSVSLAQCRQALALALDVSGSVDGTEYRLQLDGVAAALDHPRVRAAILSRLETPVDVLIYEWSAPEFQRDLVPWTAIRNPAALNGVISTLRTTQRVVAPKGTGLGSAIETGAARLVTHRPCWIRTLDVSGDGKHNMGPDPQDLKPGLRAAGITVNALVIGADDPHPGDHRQQDIAGLSSYFRAFVISGSGAFVETAIGYADYEAAMVRKLLRELQGLPVAQAVSPDISAADQ
ncbi:MAG: DUF1194 domain-containing protein [Pseudomonadota bacterium]